MKKILKALALLVILTITILVFNTFRFSSKQLQVEAVVPIEINQEKVVENLSHAIQIKTISNQSTSDLKPFVNIQQFIKTSYPNVAASLDLNVINNLSLLFKWQGSNQELPAITFLAHIDVVPAELISLDQWRYPPFSGAIAEGFVWGRGALDDKSSVFALLEAAEQMIENGYIPNRTVYFAFGHDEEVGGKQGAVKIAEYFKQNQIKSIFTLDEGMVIANEKLSPVQKPTAIIGIAEKGYTTLKITAKQEGGHSSMPNKTGAISVLAEAITALEQNQMKASLSGPSSLLFDYLGPEMGAFKKVLFANKWLFESLILSTLKNKSSTAAMIRTTTAVTMLNAGVKENVIPTQASAIVNFRIIPGDSIKDVMNHVVKTINNPAISVEPSPEGWHRNPSKVSSTQSIEFENLSRTIKQIFDGVLVTPGLVLAGTDSMHYQEVADNNYRFAPYVFGPEDVSRVHGINERIGIKDYVKMIQFYAQLIKNFDEL